MLEPTHAGVLDMEIEDSSRSFLIQMDVLLAKSLMGTQVDEEPPVRGWLPEAKHTFALENFVGVASYSCGACITLNYVPHGRIDVVCRGSHFKDICNLRRVDNNVTRT